MKLSKNLPQYSLKMA